MSLCPTEDLLRRLGADVMGDASYADLEEHVEGCETCQKHLQELIDLGLAESIEPRPWPALAALPEIPDLTIERELGRGSMGVVYLAREESLQRQVALKLLRVGMDGDGEGPRRWRLEACAASRASHPNAVQLHHVGQSGGWLYLVFEYVSGGTLKEHLREPMPPDAAARLIEDVARAVGHFHRAALLHLDLKPSNILLDVRPGGECGGITPKVADFGLARLRNEPGATTATRARPFGTPDYMAPEQAAAGHGAIGPACDVYALGATLYHALTGRPPFQAASVVQTIDQVRNQEPVPPRRLNPFIPRDLDTICLKCLQKDPRRRYESAEALADDLRRWREGRPITARPVSLAEHAWRWCRRRPAVAALSAALILTSAASLAGLARLLGHAEAERARAVAARRLAEENQGAAVSAMELLANLTSPAAFDPRSDAGVDSLDSARVLRDQILRLQAQPAYDEKILARLGDLEGRIGGKLIAEGRVKEARPLLDDAVAVMGTFIKGHPKDILFLEQQVAALHQLANLDLVAGHVDEGLGRLDEAADLVRSCGDVLLMERTFNFCWTARRNCVDRMAAAGDFESRRRVLECDRRMFDSHYFDDVILEVARARTLADLGETSRAEGILTAILKREPLDPSARAYAEQMLCGLSVDRFLWQPADAAPEAWADVLLAEIDERRRRFKIVHEVAPGVAWYMGKTISVAATEQRRSGRLDVARLTVERFRALADQLLRRSPVDLMSQLVLSEAIVQQAKSAWKAGDDSTARDLEREAAEVARQALEIAPDQPAVRQVVEDRERRVARLGDK